MQIFPFGSMQFAAHIDFLSRECSNFSPLYSATNNLYYSAYHQKEWHDLSFSVCLGGVALAAFMICFEETSGFSYYSLPCTLLINPNIDNVTQERAVSMVLKQLKSKLMSGYQFCYQELPSPALSTFATSLLEKGYRGKFGLVQRIPLTLSEDEIWRQMRKVYRKNIAWGEKNIILKLVDENNYRPADIESFRALHLEVAGRETRSKSSWLRQGDMVLNGEAFIVQGYLNDKMISASLFMHNQHSCYYGVGVYKRDLFEFSISHYPVWWAICKAKKLGCQFFDFGEMYFSNTAHLRPTNPTEKELSISHFKQGFSGLSVPILQIEGN